MKLFAFLLLAGVVWSQTPAPNCQYKYRFTNRTGEPTDGVTVISGAAAAPWINNTQNACVAWQLQYSSEGFSAISLNLQSATRQYAGVMGASTPGTVATYSGTDVVGALPLTSTSGGAYIGYGGFFPYMRVNLATATGTGTVEVTLNGWFSITYAKGLGVSGAASGDLTGSYPNPLIAANAVTSAKMAVVNTRRVCSIVIGADNGTALTDADIGPQREQCKIPYAATVVEIDVNADAGVPSVIPYKRICTTYVANVCTVWTTTNLVSSALAAAAGGFDACSKTTAALGLDNGENGGTMCSATLQNTIIDSGTWFGLLSGTAGGTAKRLSVDIIYVVN